MAVQHVFEDHLTVQQAKAEQEMLLEFEAGSYTLENPLVKYNLYQINPLSAVVCFTTETEVAATVTVKGKKPQGTISHTFPKTKTHILPIVGLYSNYTNTVEISLYRGASHTIEIMVPDVFDGKEVCYSMDTTPEYLQDNMIFLSPSGADLAVAFDYAGDARWHLNVPCVFDVKRLKNGNLLMGSSRLIQLPYYLSGLYEMSPCGKIYKEYRIPGGFHHDQLEMEDGNFLVLTEDLRSDTVEDCCVLIDRETGEIIKEWDFKKSFQKAFGDSSEDPSNWFNTKGIGQSGSWSHEDWFHNNAVWYDENTDSLTFSGRHMDSMINLDYETGDLNWIITDPTGWPEELQEKMKKYFFTPVGNNFGWQYEQHACVITPNGDVMCFDNHHYGAKKADTEHQLLAKNNYSRGVRYKINTDDMTIEQVWEYGKDRGAEFFSPYISNVEYFNENHYLVHSGGIAFSKDGVPEHELLGPLSAMHGGKLHAITVEICDNKKMLELHVPGNYYRAEKMPLYCNENNLEMGQGQVIGSLNNTKEFDTELPAEVCGEVLPDSFEGQVKEETDFITFYGTFEKGQLVMLQLEQGEEIHRYFISTSAMQFMALCVGTFMTKDSRNTRTFISKTGLKGIYDVRIIVEDKKYETGVKVTC